MQWDANAIEREIRVCSYFAIQGFSLRGKEVRKPGTELEMYVFTLDNSLTDRSIEILFAPPRADGRPAVSLVNLVKTSTDDGFNLEHYIKQYHAIVLGKGFRYTDYTGTFQERVRAFLEFATDLLTKYAEPTLQGLEWPRVEHDWAGYK